MLVPLTSHIIPHLPPPPYQLLAPLRPLISKSRTVEFQFAKNDQSSLESLHNVMETGFSGCVHFGNNTQCDIKVLMLLYNKKTRGFIGFIPDDQKGFVNGIHQIITGVCMAARVCGNVFLACVRSYTGVGRRTIVAEINQLVTVIILL